MPLSTAALSAPAGASTSAVPLVDLRTGRMARGIETVLSHLRTCDEKSATRGDRFSHICSRCCNPNRHTRVVASACGHTLCGGCADSTRDMCNVCFEMSTFVKIVRHRERECGVCFNQAPHLRVILPVCGHSLCVGCAVQIMGISQKPATQHKPFEINCPFCRTSSQMFFIKETITSQSDDLPDSRSTPSDEPVTMEE